MTWTPKTFGLGPERIANEWLNGLQDVVQSNRSVLRRFHAGVVWGCELSFLEDESFKVLVSAGAVISGGIYYEIAATEVEAGGPDLAFVWVFVASSGVVTTLVQADPQPAWPSETTPPDDVEENLAVLGLARINQGKTAWEFHHDIRHFVREKPNGAVLTVGDLDAGADFEHLQQALDYLFACEAGGNRVPRRILLTRSEELQAPLQVRLDGVVIEGVQNEVGAPATDEVEERVVITWSHGDITQPDAGAAVDCNEHQNVALINLHFVRQSTAAWCAVYRPGNLFHLEGCVFGEAGEDSLLAVAVDFGGGARIAAHVVDNRAYQLYRGLFGYTDSSQGEVVQNAGWLQHSLVASNYLSTSGLKEPDGNPEWNPCWAYCGKDLPKDEIPPWKDPQRYFYAIDCGLDATEKSGCRFNTVTDNVINQCFCGVRVGPYSQVRGNRIHDFVLFGVMATSTGAVPKEPEPNTNDPMGAVEVSGNSLVFAQQDGVPWWRAGVRLEVTHCYVAGNTIVAGGPACGVVHGPLALDELALVRAHFIALRDGGQAVVGNNFIMNPLQSDGSIDHGAAITRQGIGVALLSVQNRVTDNGLFHARTGIFVTAFNVVANNVIEPAVVAVFAWACNTVSANTIGWFPHMAHGLPWTTPAENEVSAPAPTTMSALVSKQIQLGEGAIMLSCGNSCTGDVIVCGGDDALAGTTSVAIYVEDWAVKMFGSGWNKYFAKFWKPVDPLEKPLVMALGDLGTGANTITGPVIQLAAPSGASSSQAGTWGAHGILLNSNQADNLVADAFVWRGLMGIIVVSGGAELMGCTVWRPQSMACIALGSSPVQISGGAFLTVRSRTMMIASDAVGSTVSNCLIWQAGVSSFSQDGLECMQIEADQVQVNNCALINYASHCLEWRGSFGVCGGCYFHAGDSAPQSDPSSQQLRFSAIRFATTGNGGTTDCQTNTYPNAATQGNLVYGAHMLNCQPLGAVDSEQSPIEWPNAHGMYNRNVPGVFTLCNPDPPVYAAGRWTNRISVESCYYWIRP